MSSIVVNGSALGGPLETLLMASEIMPGDAPSYQLCKTIYAYHPLGAKLAEKPITMAQSQPREIAVPKGPETKAKEQFRREWLAINADKHIFNLMRLSRVYGVSSIALLVKDMETNVPVDYTKLYKQTIAFNVFDPLNTAGSLVINQIPNAMDFMKTSGRITVAGTTYHSSRTCVMMNEDPLYIEYTVSAFGFVGRSVYQRILFPLKSFIQSMKTDDLVTIKAGVLVAMLKQAGSVVNGVMQKLFASKREVVKEAVTSNVISVGSDDSIESLNLRNLEGPLALARKHILENIASGADDMPAKLLNSETFAEGFGEGTEDARAVSKYIERIREKMAPAYSFFDTIVMYRAWNPEFYKTVQAEFPEQYAGIPYETAFYDWANSFTAKWPSYLEEPPSEKVQVDDVKLKAVIAMVQVLLPAADPENRARVIEWACDNFNSLKLLFDSPLELDFEALKSYDPAEALEEPGQPKPFAKGDSAEVREAVAMFSEAVQRMVATRDRKIKLVGGSRS